MDGISTYGANQYNVTQILQTQKNEQNLQQQLTSGKISTTYSGIANDSQKVIQLENEHTLINNFTTTNTMVNLRLTATSTAVSAITTTMSDFRTQLQDFANTGKTDPASISQIQQQAFTAMKAMESYLNSDVNGVYVFGGSKTEQQPVNINAADLATFQANYDGLNTTYAVSRAADVANTVTSPASTGPLTFSAAAGTISAANIGQFAKIPVGSIITAANAAGTIGRYTVGANDGQTITVGPSFTTEAAAPLTITGSAPPTIQATSSFTAPATLTAAAAGAFAALPVGSTISIAGAVNHNNNGGFIIASNNGTTITIQRPVLPNTVSATANLTATSAFQGTDSGPTQQIDKTKSLATATTALDPAFEKAIRAMGMIAQGVYNTAGGLDKNPQRGGDALFLMNDAIQHTQVGPAPFNNESPRSLQDVQFTVATQQKTLSDVSKAQTTYLSTLQGSVDSLENVDSTTTITTLLAEQQALQASYQSLAKTSSMSLLNFLK